MNLRLRDIRKVQNLTQGELAMKVGVSERKLAGWERGETNITLEDAVSCAVALGCTPNDLCGWYIDHPEDRPAPLKPDSLASELVSCYSQCTVDRQAALIQYARDAALASGEAAERPAVQEAV